MKRSRAPSVLLTRKVVKTEESTPIHKENKVTINAITTNDAEKEEPTTPIEKKKFVSPLLKKTPPKAFKSPLLKTTPTKAPENNDAELTLCFEVFWTQRSNKKHKKYSDGILFIKGRNCLLKNIDGKEIGKTTQYSKQTLSDLKEGNTLDVGTKEIEIVRPRTEEEYYSGVVFSSTVHEPTPSPSLKLRNPVKFKPHASAEASKVITLTPVFDPNAEGAIVLYTAVGNTDSSGKPHCSVVIDPFVSKQLRPHQVEGVKFLYDCTVGLRNKGWQGCILADSMGLGKTLQAITLLHTLLKPGMHGTPLIKKALIVCPSSLVENWRRELKRWLGVRLVPMVIGGEETKQNADKITAFGSGSANKVLIISYDFFRRLVDKFKEITSIDLLLLDEGHKLKSASSLVTKAILAMPTRRRVILSGTPIQNDLEEFFVMMDLVNPNVLGSVQQFKQVYEKPILLSRDRNCSKDVKKEGEMRSRELSKRCTMFILRRPSSILIPYLPPKVEQVVFCRLSQLQFQLYKVFLESKAMTDMSESPCYAFKCIQLIQKLCNHPDLIYDKCNDESSEFGKAISKFPADYKSGTFQPQFSGKMFVLDQLLKQIREEKNSKVVVVSNFTKTLNVIENLCKARDYQFLRLDGQTESSKRMKYVERFNSKHSTEFLFLLSSKAGGVGLNLIGGSRLILFDPNWNPATDEQAMARIWREGQKKPVWIYRFLSTGSIEEKIYQRQMMKMALSRSIVDDQFAEKNHFTKDELKKLFILNLRTDCETHDLIQCQCHIKETTKKAKDKSRLHQIVEVENNQLLSSFGQGNGWSHYASPKDCCDPMLNALASSDALDSFDSKECVISYVFDQKSKPLEEYEIPSDDPVPLPSNPNSDFKDEFSEDEDEVNFNLDEEEAEEGGEEKAEEGGEEVEEEVEEEEEVKVESKKGKEKKKGNKKLEFKLQGDDDEEEMLKLLEFDDD